MYNAKIILDSISTNGRRLTTFELTYPRFVHSEFLTHRIISRNSASSRAIPTEKLLGHIESDPVFPVYWGANQKGMQATEELSAQKQDEAVTEWLRLRDLNIQGARNLAKIGVHKQLANRVVESWMFITVIVSATSWTNFFHLRDHWQAQPEIAHLARLMKVEFEKSEPFTLDTGEWHLPFIRKQDHDESLLWSIDPKVRLEMFKQVSVGRVARVSYLTHNGVRDPKEDIALHDRLLEGSKTGDPIHMSPFEHIAMALDNKDEVSGNFKGWKQYRKEINNEHFGEVMA